MASESLHAYARFMQARRQNLDEQQEFSEFYDEENNQFVEESQQILQELSRQGSQRQQQSQSTLVVSDPSVLRTKNTNLSCSVSSANGAEGYYIDDELLVQEVQENRCLWDTSTRSFKENNKKMEAWKNIALKLGMPNG